MALPKANWGEVAEANVKTFRRNKLRRVGKVLARIRRSLRRELVHAAGCHFRFDPCICASRLLTADDLAFEAVVSVPRSLRPQLGRWTGKATL
jgi:hypothetical protein